MRRGSRVGECSGVEGNADNSAQSLTAIRRQQYFAAAIDEEIQAGCSAEIERSCGGADDLSTSRRRQDRVALATRSVNEQIDSVERAVASNTSDRVATLVYVVRNDRRVVDRRAALVDHDRDDGGLTSDEVRSIRGIGDRQIDLELGNIALVGTRVQRVEPIVYVGNCKG